MGAERPLNRGAKSGKVDRIDPLIYALKHLDVCVLHNENGPSEGPNRQISRSNELTPGLNQGANGALEADVDSQGGVCLQICPRLPDEALPCRQRPILFTAWNVILT